MITPDRVRQCEPLDSWNDDLGWLVRQALHDSMEGAEPSPVVWRRIRQEIVTQAQPGAIERVRGLWRRWQLRCDAAHTALEAAASHRYYDRRQWTESFYFAGIPFLVGPQALLWTVI